MELIFVFGGLVGIMLLFVLGYFEDLVLLSIDVSR